MHRDPIMEASEYSRIPSMPGLQEFHKVLNMPGHKKKKPRRETL